MKNLIGTTQYNYNIIAVDNNSKNLFLLNQCKYLQSTIREM